MAEPRDHLDENTPAAKLLRQSRPTPDAAFVSELEDKLLPARQPARRPRPLIAALAAGGATAAFVAILTLAGAGPLAGDNSVNANRNCQTVTIHKRERVPTLVNGDVRLRYATVERRVERCR
jgi:hypothetical protein